MKLSIIFTLPALLAAALAVNLQNVPKYPANRVAHSATHLKRGHSDVPCYTYDELYKMQIKFLDNFIAPKNLAQARSINSSLLAPDVQGRVDVTRTFIGSELNTEYLFGLFANLAATNTFTLLGSPLSYEVTHFAATQNIASASTRFNFSFSFLGGLSVPVQIDTWNVFDKDGKISEYDATFKWWSWTVDYLFQTAAQSANKTLAQILQFATTGLVDSICATAQTYCNGTNVQYNSPQQCKTFLTTQVPFGEAYQLGQDTLLCRMVHQNMVPFRPSIHCPHIGPSGGEYCVNSKYEDTVTEDFFTNLPFILYGKNGRK